MLPQTGIVELCDEELVDLPPSHGIDITHHGRTLPQHTIGGHTAHPRIVVVAEALPQRAAVGEPIVPRHMVKPQQILFGAGLEMLIERPVGFAILCRGSGPRGHSAVKAQSLCVGLMIVDGTPLQGIFRLVAIGLRTIVMVEGEDMVQAERHHIIDACLMRGEHHILQCRNRDRVATAKGLEQPLMCDLR